MKAEIFKMAEGLKALRTVLVWMLLAYYEALIASFSVCHHNELGIYTSALILSSSAIFFVSLSVVLAGKAKKQFTSCVFYEVYYSLEYTRKTEFRAFPLFYNMYIGSHKKDQLYAVLFATLALLNAIGACMYLPSAPKKLLLPFFLVLFTGSAIEALVLIIKIKFLKEDYI